MTAPINDRCRDLFSAFIPDDLPYARFVQSIDHQSLLAVALRLDARTVPGWSEEEEQLAKCAGSVSEAIVERIRQFILCGRDPLGDVFCNLRPPAQRRRQGATFTPASIISSMIRWVEPHVPSRIVDPGLGSGRFAVQLSQHYPEASVIGIEIDPLPALLARANFAVAGLSARSQVILGDYCQTILPSIAGKTLFIGNPPYVRHHLLQPSSKEWLVAEAMRHGLNASQLAGLHAYFFLATLGKAALGDIGVFITSAEWLDVNYGSLVRELFLGKLGGKQIFVIEPHVLAFPDADTTAAVTSFEIGSKSKSIRLKRLDSIEDLQNPNAGRLIRRERLETEKRWSHLVRVGQKPPGGYVELGELCRVHRGQVTGSNKVWIEGPHSRELPENVFFPTVTKARELFQAGRVLDDASKLRRVIDLPVDLDMLEVSERRAVDRFLLRAKSLGIHAMYVASNRRAWWAVGLRKPAPILATYMARRPPAFVQNLALARHINIAHGLYPRESFTDGILANLAEYLSHSIKRADGRTYAGGLTKFEPREMERILVPSPELLAKGQYDLCTTLVF